jgi:hypothetical protein
MAFISKKKPATLADQLADKAAELRINEEVHGRQAKTYLEIAAEAKADSKQASIQASAVERAHAIITDAGVTL